MADGWAARWADAWTGGARRFNTNHAPAGSAAGGQFTTGGSGSSSSGNGGHPAPAKSGGKGAAAHPAARPLTAHQKHEAHLKYLASHPDTPGARAQQKAALLEQAKADRAKAATLERQLKGLNQQEAKAAQTAKHAKAAAANAKAGPRQKRTLAHAAAAGHKKHATLKAQISSLQDRIAGLLDKAKTLEAQAAKL